MDKNKHIIRRKTGIYILTGILMFVVFLLEPGKSGILGRNLYQAAAEERAELSDTEITVSQGETYALTVNGSYKKVTWKVNRKSIATVNSKGVVTGVSKGTTNVIATVDGIQYKCKVYVEEPVLNKTKIRYRLGSSCTLKVSGTKREVTFKSSNTSVVTVSSSGKMIFTGPGTAKVYAMVGKTRLTCSVTVPKPSIKIPDMKLGEVSSVDMGGKSYSRLSFYSSDPSVLAVDQNGNLTAKKAGTAAITVKIANYEYSRNVHVTNDIYAAAATGNLEGLSEKDARIAKKAHQILENVIAKDMTEVEKIRAVHDYIVLNTAYDFQNYLNGTLPAVSYEIEGVLFEHAAVCQGYAEAMQLFLNALGIENQLIYGYGWGENAGSKGSWISHVWNLVWLEDGWYHLDVTWDDPLMDGADIPDYVDYTYFLIDDSAMDDNHKWTAEDYPAADGGKYSEYVTKQELEAYRKEGQLLDSVKDYEAEVLRRFEEGDREIVLLYPEDTMPDIHAILQKLANQYNKGVRADYQTEKTGNYTKLTLSITLQ